MSSAPSQSINQSNNPSNNQTINQSNNQTNNQTISLTPQEEARQFSAVYDPTLNEGKKFNLLSSDWFTQWCEYSGFDVDNHVVQSNNQSNNQSNDSTPSPDPSMQAGRWIGTTFEAEEEIKDRPVNNRSFNQSNNQSSNGNGDSSSMDESSDQPIKQPVPRPGPWDNTQLCSMFNQSIKQSGNQSNDQSINQSNDQSNNEYHVLHSHLQEHTDFVFINQPAYQLLMKWYDHPNNQAINQSIIQTIEQSTDQSNDEQPAKRNKRSEQAFDQQIDQSNNQSNDHSNNQSANEVVKNPPTRCGPHIVRSVISRGLTEELIIELHPLNIFVRYVDIDGTIFDQSINQTNNQSLFQYVALHTVSRDWTLRQLVDTLRPDIRSINQSNDQSIYSTLWPTGVTTEGRVWLKVYPSINQTTSSPNGSPPPSATESSDQSNNQSIDQSNTQSNNQSIDQSFKWELMHEREYSTSVEMIDWVNGTEIAVEYQIPINIANNQSNNPTINQPVKQVNNQSNNQTNKSVNSQLINRWCRSSDPRFVPFTPSNNPTMKQPINWAIGDTIDARDTQYKWFESTIMDIDQSNNQSNNKARIYVHFKGWADKWREWLTVDKQWFDESNNQSKYQSVKFDRVAPQSFFTTGARDPAKLTLNQSIGQSNTQSSKFATEGHSVARGCVGLTNLGNTCFMNSILQSINQSPILTDYFISGAYTTSINLTNPLGFAGKIAIAYAELVGDMWAVERQSINQSITQSTNQNKSLSGSNKSPNQPNNQSNNQSTSQPIKQSSNQVVKQSRGRYSMLAPRIFKQVIGAYQPRFSGYQQHDSSEFLSFLLDGLHEDLNRVIDKPRTDPVDYNQTVNRFIHQHVDRLIKSIQTKYQTNNQAINSSAVAPNSPSNSLTNLSINQSISQSSDGAMSDEDQNSSSNNASKATSIKSKGLQLTESTNQTNSQTNSSALSVSTSPADSHILSINQSIYRQFKLTQSFADALVARESWSVYQSRNQSIITDHFMGQYKSTLICPVCSNATHDQSENQSNNQSNNQSVNPGVSITFDPFQFISLPLVNQSTNQQMKLCFVPSKKTCQLMHQSTSQSDVRPLNLIIDLPNQATAFDVKQSLIKLINQTIDQSTNGDKQPNRSNKQSINIRTLLLVNVKDNRIVKAVRENETLDINQSNNQQKHSKYSYHQSNSASINQNKSNNQSNNQPIYWMFEIPELVENLPTTKIEAVQAQSVVIMQSNDLSFNQTASQPNDQSANQSINQPKHLSGPLVPGIVTIPSSWMTNCSLERLFDRIDHAIEPFVKRPADQSENEPEEQPLNEATSTQTSSPSEPTTEEDVDMEPTVKHEPDESTVAMESNGHQEIKQESTLQSFQRSNNRSNPLQYTLIVCDREGKVPFKSFSRPANGQSDNQFINLVELNRGGKGLSFTAVFPSSNRSNDPSIHQSINQSTILLPADFPCHPSFNRPISHHSGSHPINLYDCFNQFSQPEILRPSESWYCQSCKQHQQASKQFELFKLPDCLIVQLKRFSFTHTSRTKIDRLIDFPIEGLKLRDLSKINPSNNPSNDPSIWSERPSTITVDGQTVDLSNINLDETRVKSQSNNQSNNQTNNPSRSGKSPHQPNQLNDSSLVEYDLYAVSQHYGGLGGGHYTAVIKNLRNGIWYSMDDSSVSVVGPSNTQSNKLASRSPVTEDDSINASINPSVRAAIVTPAAYVLFYKKRGLSLPEWKQKKFRQ